MRIGVIGSGYVGLVTGACLAGSGNHVVSVDNDERKVKSLAEGLCPIFEPGLQELMRENLRAGRLRFTASMAEGLQGAKVAFIAVGTPPRADGSADLSAIDAVAAEIGKALSGPLVAVTKSTVPVGTGSRVEKIIAPLAKHPVHVVSNPEFLKEGSALEDFLRPDRVVIGANDADAGKLVAELYKPFVRNNKPIVHMSRVAAEMTKYAANAYLATRISFINEVSELCEKFDVDITEVRTGIGYDSRIGFHFLYPGVGYGGSCFPKDVQALANTAKAAGVDCGILDAVHRRNQAQRERLFQRIVTRLGGLQGKRLAVWGLAFKPKTDDIREAPAITIIEKALQAGATVAAHDPHALENAKQAFNDPKSPAAAFAGRIAYHTDAYDALAGADALAIMTEWSEFRSPDFDRMRAALKQPIIFDGRNLYDAETARRYNFEYHSVGRPVVRPG